MSSTEPVSGAGAVCELTLFVSGASELSAYAIAATRRLCNSDAGDLCRLLVVDVHDDPCFALSMRVVAAPTLIKTKPLPERRCVGDLSRTETVRLALGFDVAEDTRG